MTTPDSPPSGAYSRQDLVWWGALFLIVGGVLGAGLMRLLMPTGAAPVAARPAEPMPVFGRISDFSLTDSSGETITRDDLAGRVWVVDFFFTSCATICPRMTERFVELQAQLGDNPQVTLVSISVDPERDTPERLRRYGEKYGANPVMWWFLTGDMDVIRRLSEDSFHLGLEDAPAGGGTDQVLHSSKFVLLDRKARIRGYYDGLAPGTAEILAADIHRLLRE